MSRPLALCGLLALYFSGDVHTRNLVVAASQDTVLVKFFGASWCGPCTRMLISIDSVKSVRPDGLKVDMVNIEDSAGKTLAAAYKVDFIPTVMLYRNGQLLWRESGFKTGEELMQVLDSCAASK